MPRPSTKDQKEEAVKKYFDIVNKWHLQKQAISERDLKRMGLKKIEAEITKITVIREDRIAMINNRLNQEGRRDEIIRPSGLVFTRKIMPKDGNYDTMFFNKLKPRPNQIIKVVVQKTDGTREIMNLDDFNDFIVGYGESKFEAVLEVQMFTLSLSGGCATRSGQQQVQQINDYEFHTTTVKTDNNDCIFAVMSKFKEGKQKYAKTVRRELGFEPDTMISTDQLQKIADYYQMNIMLYYSLGEEIIILDIKSAIETKQIATVLLHKEHYYVVNKVIAPEFKQIKTKFDELIHNIANKKDNCKFEKFQETEFNGFEQIVDYIIKSSKHIFIHGQAGTGKSVISQMIRDKYKSIGKELIITSSQGISAIAINGQTIHSQITKLKCQKKKFQNDVLIDEIGFLDGCTLDDVIKKIGGNRLILVGDLRQLPPVKHDTQGFFFEAMQYQEIHDNLTHIELTRVKRQDNEQFVNILSKIRSCQFDSDVYQFIDQHKSTNQPQEIHTIIASRNKSVDAYNESQIQKLIDNQAQSQVFVNEKCWDLDKLKELFGDNKKDLDAYMAKHQQKMERKTSITLYVGERVFLTNNMLDHGLANGSRGVIKSFTQQSVKIYFEIEKVLIDITPVVRYNKSVTEMYSKKIPLRPSYALTIHKSQGMTIRTPLYADIQGVWQSELLYVALSRVTDKSLLTIYNGNDKYKISYDAFKPNQTITDYLHNQIFHQIGFKMIIEDEQKQMLICDKPKADLFQANQIDMDFETAEYTYESGLVSHRPYYNHIKHYKNKKLIYSNTFQDYDQESETFSPDVAQSTFDYIIQAIHEYENELIACKQTNDKKLISKCLKNFIRIVTYNGAGFDLYFLLQKLLQTEGFATTFQIKNIFKGNKLVYFALYSLKAKSIVLQSFDIFQIISNGSLKQACNSFCKDQAEKIVFKNEIIYLAKHRYTNPEIMQDKITKLQSEEIVEILDENTWKMVSLKKEDGWTIEEDDIDTLKCIARNQENIGRRFKVKIFKEMNLRKALDEYAKNDTDVLSVLLKALDDICHQTFDCSILNFLTAGALCWYGSQKYASKEIFAESKYDKNRHLKTRKHGNRIKTHLYRNELDEEQFVLKSIIGGKSGPRVIQIKNGKRYIYLDISGMYCDLMMRHNYPFGKKQWLNNKEMKQLQDKLIEHIPKHSGDQLKDLKNIRDKVIELHDKYFPNLFICTAEFDENPISLEPMIQFKKRVGGSDENPQYKTQYTNERRFQTITSIDLITILLKGGNLYNITQCLLFEKQGKILKKWMEKCLEIKNEGKKNNQPAKTSFGKLLANGTYGQTLKQDRHEVIKFVDNQWETNDFASKYKLTNAFITDSNIDILIGKELVNKTEFVTSRCSYLGSFVLAYSRLAIQDIIQIINPEQDPEKQPLYGDTDSLVVREDLVKERLIQSGYVQAKSGLLADELADTCGQQFFYPPDCKNITEDDIKNPDNYKFCYIDEGLFIQPKTIAIKYIDIDGKPHTKIRAKGIPTSSCFGGWKECMSQKLFFDLYNQSIQQNQGQEVRLPNGLKTITPNMINGELNKYGQQVDQIKKNEALFNIIPTSMTRKLFNTQYKGRLLHKDDPNIFVPYGHPLAQQQEGL